MRQFFPPAESEASRGPPGRFPHAHHSLVLIHGDIILSLKENYMKVIQGAHIQCEVTTPLNSGFISQKIFVAK